LGNYTILQESLYWSYLPSCWHLSARLCGQPPYTWALVNGTLPPGLTLDPATGMISGTPTAAVTSQVSIRITDTSVSPYTGQAQVYERQFTIQIRS
jgi:hypothetical protein